MRFIQGREKTVLLISIIIGAVLIMINYKDNFKLNHQTDRASETIQDLQLKYLKTHEVEIIEFIKNQNDKIESVQIDWEQTKWGKGGFFTEEKYLTVYGRINQISNSSWSVHIFLNEDGSVDMDSMTTASPLRIGGELLE